MKSKKRIRYKQIAGFPGYRVGSDGSIWSNRNGGKVARFGHKPKWKKMSLRNRKRYLVVSLFRNAKQVNFDVHRVVLEAFRGPCPDGFQGLHRDGNNHNNSIQNLKWGTAKENSADSARHGTQARGERHGLSVLDDTDVMAIKKMLRNGVSQKMIAEKFSVTPSNVSAINRGKSWRHVT